MPRRRPLARTLSSFAGLTLIVVGVPVFVMPIPLGAIMIVSGALLLLRASPRARLLRRAFARRFPDTTRRIERWRITVRARSGV